MKLFYIIVVLNMIFVGQIIGLKYPGLFVPDHNAYNTKLPLNLVFGEINKKYNGRSMSLTEDISEAKDVEETINNARAVYWVPTSCDSLAERGYTCLSCYESLHCMAGNFALKAICGGRRPFCANGVCSDLRSEKCRRDQDTRPAAANDAVPSIEESSNITMTSDSGNATKS